MICSLVTRTNPLTPKTKKLKYFQECKISFKCEKKVNIFDIFIVSKIRIQKKLDLYYRHIFDKVA